MFPHSQVENLKCIFIQVEKKKDHFGEDEWFN